MPKNRPHDHICSMPFNVFGVFSLLVFFPLLMIFSSLFVIVQVAMAGWRGVRSMPSFRKAHFKLHA